MRKQIISNAEQKLNIVILSDEATNIIAKGMARCHDGDEYNEELGIQIANSRAWLKYYEKLAKYNEKRLQDWQDYENWCIKRREKAEYTINLAKVRAEQIKNEYEELLKTV